MFRLVEQQVLVPQIQIQPRAADLAVFGLTAGEVRRQAQTLIAGQKLGEIYRDQKSFDVALWGEPAMRGDIAGSKRSYAGTSGSSTFFTAE